MERKSALERLRDLNVTIIISLLVGILVVLTVQIVSRSFFNTAHAWAEEVSRYLFVYMVLGSAALAYEKNMWVSVDLISNRLSVKAKRVFDIVVELIVFGFFITVAAVSVQFVVSSKGQLTAALQIPIGWAYAAFPIFFIQMTIISAGKIAAYVKGGK